MQKFYSQKTCWACYEIFAQFSPSAILPVRTGQNLSDRRFLYASFFLRPGKSRAICKGGGRVAFQCVKVNRFFPGFAAHLNYGSHCPGGNSFFLKFRGDAQNVNHGNFIVSRIHLPRHIVIFLFLTRHDSDRRRNFSVQLRKKHISRAYVAEYHLVRRMKPVNPVRIKLHVFSFRNRVPVEPRQPLKVIFSPRYFYFSCCLKGLLNEPISTRFPSGSAM